MGEETTNCCKKYHNSLVSLALPQITLNAYKNATQKFTIICKFTTYSLQLKVYNSKNTVITVKDYSNMTKTYRVMVNAFLKEIAKLLCELFDEKWNILLITIFVTAK